MRVVVDINIIVSALIVTTGNPATIIDAWLAGEFTLLTCAEHLDELHSTLQKPSVSERIKPHKASGLVNDSRSWPRVLTSCRLLSVPAIPMTITCSP
jgi:uncharacterized protein